MAHRRLCNRITEWYLQHFIALLMIPFSFAFFVIGIYGRVFSENFELSIDDMNKDKCFGNSKCGYGKLGKITNYLHFFEYQKKLSGETLPVSDTLFCEPEINDTTTKHRHLLILDRTLSTINDKEPENQELKNSLVKSLNSFFGDTIRGDTIRTELRTKNLLVLKIYEKLLKMGSNIDSLIYITYDGAFNNSGKFTEKRVQWQNDSIKFFFRNQQDSLFFSKKGQETNLIDVFEKIESLQDTNTIVTVISDFYHEKEKISPLHIEKYLQTGSNKAKQYNFIYIVPKGDSIKLKSDELIDLLTEKIHGTNQFFVNVNSNDVFSALDALKLNLDLTQCFSPVKFSESIRSIKFYYPRDKKKYKEAECKIVFKDKTVDTCHHWKIINPYYYHDDEKFFFEIRGENDCESKVEINSKEWRSVYSTDTLILKFPLTSKIYSSQYNLSIIHDDKNVRCKIEFKEYIPYKIAHISYIMICVIVFLFLLLICLWTNKHYNTINAYIADKELKRRGHHALEINHGSYSLKYLKNRNILISFATLVVLLYSVWCCLGEWSSNKKIVIAIFSGCLLIQLFNFASIYGYYRCKEESPKINVLSNLRLIWSRTIRFWDTIKSFFR